MPNSVEVLEAGDLRQPCPFTICIASNPALETNAGFIPDPIAAQPDLFRSRARFAADALLGRIAGQEEATLKDDDIAHHVRIVSLLATSVEPSNVTALVREDNLGWLLVPRRAAISPFLARFQLSVDIVIAVTNSSNIYRATSFPTTDDDERGGVPFTLDGTGLFHRFFCRTPGSTALHATSGSVTVVHEFAHALSSYSNGVITDLYVDTCAALNNKKGRPIPANFATMDGHRFAADPFRDGLTYPAGWTSYHCEQLNHFFPSLMDNFTRTNQPGQCRHDAITRAFLRARLLAKIGR